MAAAETTVPQAAATPADARYTPETDPVFAQPYVDVDEWREAPVRHRYVHGGFHGTNTRFSYYFPPKEQYQGRFFQHITPVPDSENLAQQAASGPFDKIGSSIAGGAYFVETNGGGGIDLAKGALALGDPTITAYRANAAAAAFSRTLAQQMYGGKRPYGYAYGGSGGGFRTIGSIENTQGVWDGVVPYVIGSTMAIPNMFTVRMQALRVLRNKLPQIVDAVEPGGSGNPYAGLTPHEAAVLREIEQMGFPMKSWFGYRDMGLHGFAALYGGVAAADPTYFTDFWTRPGYLGHDHPEYFSADRVRFSSTVSSPVTAAQWAGMRMQREAAEAGQRGGVDTAFKAPAGEDGQRIVGFRLADRIPVSYFLGGELVVQSGAASGKRLMLGTLEGDVVLLGHADPALTGQIGVGDAVQVDNSNFLAMESYHRHQVPGPDFPVWDQFRRADGSPVFPQRPMLLGPIFVKATSGSEQTGRFEGKMIVAASLWDREAMPWQADWYRSRVKQHLSDRSDDHFRLWYSDHALHGDEPGHADANHVVSYVPVLNQALRDLAAWVERGIPPPPSTEYRIVNGQVLVPDDAATRQGIQPVVTLRANGKERVDIAVGESVAFAGTIEVPSGAGFVVDAEWDLDGTGAFPRKSAISGGKRAIAVSMQHRFEKPGTYFVALRGAAERQGDTVLRHVRIENLARVRVVVR